MRLSEEHLKRCVTFSIPENVRYRRVGQVEKQARFACEERVARVDLREEGGIEMSSNVRNMEAKKTHQQNLPTPRVLPAI